MDASYPTPNENRSGYARIVATSAPCKECGLAKAIGGFWEDYCPDCRTLRAARAVREEDRRRRECTAAVVWNHHDNSFDFADVDFDGDRWLLDRGIA